MVHRRCRQLLCCDDEAQDAVQEVFVRVMRSHRTLTLHYPSSLLYRIATNVSLNMIRARKRRRVAGASDEILSRIALTDRRYAQLEARRVLDKVFTPEPESTRLIATRHFAEGMTLEEVAREARLSVSGVRKRIRVLRAQPHVAALNAAALHMH